MGDLIEQKKREIEARRQNQKKEELYRTIIRHFIGMIYAVAELHLGYRPDLKQ